MKKLLFALCLALAVLPISFAHARIHIKSGDIADNSVGDNDLANGSVNALKISDNAITEPKFNATDSPADEECLTYETTGSVFEWQACAATLDDAYNNAPSGNKVIVADDGTVTIQASGTSAGLAITRSDNNSDYARFGLFTVQGDNDTGVGTTNPTSVSGRTLAMMISADARGNGALPGLNLKSGNGFTTGNTWEMALGGFSATEASWFLSGGGTTVFLARSNGNLSVGNNTRLFFDDVTQATGNDYITDATSDNVSIVVGGTTAFSVVPTGIKISNNEVMSTYDEGTCSGTVTLVGGAGNTVPQYSSVDCHYTKVGREVTEVVNLLGDGGNEGAGTGQVNIGIPFAGATITNGQCQTVAVVQNGAAFYNTQVCVDSGGTTARLYKHDSITTYSNVTGNDQNSTSRSTQYVIKYFAGS
jgi:hypothetical protein